MFSKIYQVLKRTKIEKKTNKIRFLTQKKECPHKGGHYKHKRALSDNFLIVSGLLSKFIRNIRDDIHDFRHERAILGNRHDAHVIALDDEERDRVDRSATARCRRIALVLVATKAKANGHAAHRHDGCFARLDRFTNDSFRLRDVAELFQKSFCKFFNSHILNIVIKINT